MKKLLYIFALLLLSCEKDEEITDNKKYKSPCAIFMLCGTQTGTPVDISFTLMNTAQTDTIKHWTKRIVYGSEFSCDTPLLATLALDGLPENGTYYQEAKATCLNCNPYPLSSYSFTGEISLLNKSYKGIYNAEIVAECGVRIQ